LRKFVLLKNTNTKTTNKGKKMGLINLTQLTIKIASKDDKRKFIEIKPSGKLAVSTILPGSPIELQINEYEFLLYKPVDDQMVIVLMDGTNEEPFPEMQYDVYYIVPFYIKREKELRNRPDVITYLDYEIDNTKNTMICYSFYS
jgi:hypothetical protein